MRYDKGSSPHSSYSEGEVALHILRDMVATLNVIEETTTKEWGHCERISE